ncbi:MAG TPA: histidinol-phosphatase [Casimicrobiaceae bacterium]|nr:histidinol-phosphatase [Casimicrobiaceae bacterium]
MTGADLSDCLDFARHLAAAAGAAILPHFRVPLEVQDKGDAGDYDPVTEADRAAERLIRESIARRFPEHRIRGEEEGISGGDSPLTWAIDPIDGTRSFVLGQLHWGTLIALHDGIRPVLGVAHQPFIGETFSAMAGREATWQRDGERRTLRSRACPRLDEAMLACTTPDMFATDARRAAFERVRARVRLTRFGSDCYGYCLLAMGLIDAVVESDLQAYDVQALIPIVEAAGGVITRWDGGPCDEGGDVVACGDRTLHTQVLAVLRS